MIINDVYIKSELVNRMHFIMLSGEREYAKIFLSCDSVIEVNCTKEEFLNAIRELEKKEGKDGAFIRLPECKQAEVNDE